MEQIVQEKKEEALSIVDEARKVRDEIRSENDRRENILREEQKLKANEMLAGTAGGGVQVVVREETAKEYAARVLAGKVKAK